MLATPAGRKALASHLGHGVQQVDRTCIGRLHADLVEQLGLDARGDAATLGTLRGYQGLILLHKHETAPRRIIAGRRAAIILAPAGRPSRTIKPHCQRKNSP